MSDLEALAKKFKEWRGNRGYCRYPNHFWEEVKLLSEKYPILRISRALNMSSQYLRIKLAKTPKQLTFAPLKVTSFPSSISIEFTNSCNQPTVVRFEASQEQIVNMILSLSVHSL